MTGLTLMFIGLMHQAIPDVNPQTFRLFSGSVCFAQSEELKIADSIQALDDEETGEVVALWQKYIAAARANEDHLARSCWNTYEINRYEKYNLFSGRQNYYNLVRIASDILTNIEKEGDDLKLTIQWCYPISLKPLITESKYCVKEGNRFVLANTIYKFKSSYSTTPDVISINILIQE